jgi:hypothetical protein
MDLARLIARYRARRSERRRFRPPRPAPGDIWNLGVPFPPKRSSNWPIRLGVRVPNA